jgi:nucleoside phosphorylase
MHVGPGTVKDLLDWFFGRAAEKLLCLFVGGGPFDYHLLEDLFIARDSINVVTGDDVAVFFQVSPTLHSRLAGIKVLGNHTHILPLVPALGKHPEPSPSDRNPNAYDWESETNGYMPVDVSKVDAECQDAVIRSTIQFSSELCRFFRLSATDLPCLIVIPKTWSLAPARPIRWRGLTLPTEGGAFSDDDPPEWQCYYTLRSQPIVFRHGNRFDAEQFFILLKELKEAVARNKREDDDWYASDDDHARTEAAVERLVNQEQAALKYQRRFNNHVRLLAEALNPFGLTEHDEGFRELCSNWLADSESYQSRFASWTGKHLDQQQLKELMESSSLIKIINDIESTRKKAAANKRYIDLSKEKGIPRLSSRPPFRMATLSASALKAIESLIKKHQSFLDNAGATQSVATSVIEAVSGSAIGVVQPDRSIGKLAALVVIALREEFDEFAKLTSLETRWHNQLNTYINWFSVKSSSGSREESAVICLDGMGTEGAAHAVGVVTNTLLPRTIISLGIAGGISSDVMLGDVVIGEQVDGYHVGAKAEAAGRFLLSGDVYRSTYKFVQHANNLALAHSEAFKLVAARCRGEFRRFVDLASVRDSLLTERIVRGTLHVKTGHLASGPFVVASREFAHWLLSRDRKYLAVEMEAYGVLLGAHRCKTDGLVIRGISDLADERKAAMDSVGGGVMRRHAMRNATRILLLMMSLELVS